MNLSPYFLLCGVLPLALSGCFLGELGGSPAPADPYLREWEKLNVTDEQRREDSRSCGSTMLETSSFPDNITFNNQTLVSNQLPGEDDNRTYARLFNQWQSCMLSKGYRFSGECSDNEVSRSQPACRSLISE
jgi:hypothetical protein